MFFLCEKQNKQNQVDGKAVKSHLKHRLKGHLGQRDMLHRHRVPLGDDVRMWHLGFQKAIELVVFFCS